MPATPFRSGARAAALRGAVAPRIAAAQFGTQTPSAPRTQTQHQVEHPKTLGKTADGLEITEPEVHAPTLEWILGSPPRIHEFDESPVFIAVTDNTGCKYVNPDAEH